MTKYNCRKDCRTLARELGIREMIVDALQVPCGTNHRLEECGLIITNVWMGHSKLYSVKLAADYCEVYRQEGSSIEKFHNGSWVSDLRCLAEKNRIVANFSC